MLEVSVQSVIVITATLLHMYVVHVPAPVHPSWFPQRISVEEGGLHEGKTGQVCTGWLCAGVHVSLYYCTVKILSSFMARYIFFDEGKIYLDTTANV